MSYAMPEWKNTTISCQWMPRRNFDLAMMFLKTEINSITVVLQLDQYGAVKLVDPLQFDS